MKIALIGASGFVGSAILDEAVSRGHHVTAIVRDTSKVAPHPQITTVAVDAQDPQALADVLKGQDRVISAYNPGWSAPDIHDQYLKGASAIVEAAKAAHSWLLVVGGAGSLEIAPGVQLVDTPDFPAEWKQGALAARDGLTALRREAALDWRFVSPPVFLEPGEKRGGYRLGGDQVLFSGDKPAGITVGDLADAVLNEAEQPAHLRQRFTLGY
ncbi:MULTISPECIES: NAD(P)-dependent oxidoreductase [Aeromonas]|uniref:NAD(P)-dependent oxidoreductase n=1 Tax=Aeromonas TaxID=642 RepID=UPI00259ECDA1|nr:NAD(P)-dependent oxidoreductase [Aeromonas rivipollensis]MDM5084014.1 NAD(P)-dependent oxidoreductase [Aeromonas rivipollensis]MDM5097714.1 NAD(P)-dependent oxidoreductase [Aeromonas rivipollensis]MDM5104800.1 NAD(P)-dependent oxidoreductase [Aeromonas rivipollensis]